MRAPVASLVLCVLLPLAVQAAEPACGVPGPGATIHDVSVVDRNTGQVIYRGDVDLSETLRRIEAGQRAPVGRDDGTAFCGYGLDRRIFDDPSYAEYVVLPTHMRGRSPGPQRVIVGTASGRVFYSCDHYRTFVPIEPRVSLPPDRRAEIEAEAQRICRPRR